MKIETAFKCAFSPQYFQRVIEREWKFARLPDWMEQGIEKVIFVSLCFVLFFFKDSIRLHGYNSFYLDSVVNPAQRNCFWVDCGPLAYLELYWYKSIVECEMSLDLELWEKEKTVDKCEHNHMHRSRFEHTDLCGYSALFFPSLCMSAIKQLLLPFSLKMNF